MTEDEYMGTFGPDSIVFSVIQSDDGEVLIEMKIETNNDDGSLCKFVFTPKSAEKVATDMIRSCYIASVLTLEAKNNPMH